MELLVYNTGRVCVKRTVIVVCITNEINGVLGHDAVL